MSRPHHKHPLADGLFVNGSALVFAALLAAVIFALESGQF
jgi:hypothetical protein